MPRVRPQKLRKALHRLGYHPRLELVPGGGAVLRAGDGDPRRGASRILLLVVLMALCAAGAVHFASDTLLALALAAVAARLGWAAGSLLLYRMALDVVIRDGVVSAAEPWLFGLATRHWQEPLAAYRGVESHRFRWTTRQLADRDSISDMSDTPVSSVKVQREEGWAVLAHPSLRRTLPLLAQPGGPVPEERVAEVAAHLGVPVLPAG